jgi:hypothetical protein
MPWKPGQSGNPAGRAKLPKEMVELAQAATPKAIRRAIALMEHEDGNIALKAVNTVLDRAYGKPAQTIDTTIHDSRPLSDWALDELDARLTELRHSRGGGRGADSGVSASPPHSTKLN